LAVSRIGLKAVFLPTRLAASYLRKPTHSPSIVNGASLARTVAYRELLSCPARQRGVATLTKATAVDVAKSILNKRFS
jgi:hypothetical protein